MPRTPRYRTCPQVLKPRKQPPEFLRMDGDSSTLTQETDGHSDTIDSVNGRASVPRQLNVKRTGIVIRPNNSRVVIRPFEPASENRIERILGRVAALSEAEVDLLLDDVLSQNSAIGIRRPASSSSGDLNRSGAIS